MSVGAVWAWVSPKVEPETRTFVPTFYWGGDPRMTVLRGSREGGKVSRASVSRAVTAVGSLEPRLVGDPPRVGRTRLRIFSLKGEAAGMLIHQLLLVEGYAWDVNAGPWLGRMCSRGWKMCSDKARQE